MHDALAATDEIYNAALQILNGHKVDAKLVPLVMCTAAQRVEQFAIGAMAHELVALEDSNEPERGEVDNG